MTKEANLKEYQWGGNDTPTSEEEETEDEEENEEEDSETEDEEEPEEDEEELEEEENEEEDANEQSEESEEEEEKLESKVDSDEKSSKGSGFKMPGGMPLVTPLLLLLIVVNMFTSGQFTDIWNVITFKSINNPSQSRKAFLAIGGELVFLIFLSMIAESNDTANKLTTMFVVVLWLVWFFHNRSSLASFANKVLPQQQNSKTGGGRITT